MRCCRFPDGVVESALTVTTSLQSICTSCSSPGHGQGRTLERLSTLDEPRLVEDLPDRACGPGQRETAEAQGFIARQRVQQRFGTGRTFEVWRLEKDAFR
jgi:hypothetical protein